MANLAVNVAVMQEDNILVTKREDFEIWCLPSGGVEHGESLAQAAIRETKEETGLDVELTRLVGVYSRRGSWSLGNIILFAAKPVGGEIRCQAGETIAVKWFAFDDLPSPLAVGQKRRIQDAVEGVSGAVVLQDIKLPNLPFEIGREELYALRDRSGLSRQEFYLHMTDGAEIKEMIEVGAP